MKRCHKGKELCDINGSWDLTKAKQNAQVQLDLKMVTAFWLDFFPLNNSSNIDYSAKSLWRACIQAKILTHCGIYNLFVRRNMYINHSATYNGPENFRFVKWACPLLLNLETGDPFSDNICKKFQNKMFKLINLPKSHKYTQILYKNGHCYKLIS